MSLTNELKALDAFVALTSVFLLKNKDFRNNSCNVYNTKTKKSYLPQQVAKVVQTALEEHEQHKAIEEDLGIGLETYFKALNNGAWYKDTSGNICWCDMPKFSKGDIDFNGYHTTTRMYGVIWALTKEELEK